MPLTPCSLSLGLPTRPLLSCLLLPLPPPQAVSLRPALDPGTAPFPLASLTMLALCAEPLSCRAQACPEWPLLPFPRPYSLPSLLPPALPMVLWDTPLLRPGVPMHIPLWETPGSLSLVSTPVGAP